MAPRGLLFIFQLNGSAILSQVTHLPDCGLPRVNHTHDAIYKLLRVSNYKLLTLTFRHSEQYN